jgi:ankyrin repeat protein
MYLVIHDRKDLLEYLFEHYADKVDTTIKDNTEQTALDIANKKSGNSEIIEIISGTSFSNPKLIQLLNLIRDKKKQKADDFIKNQVTLEELASAKDKSGRTLLMYAAMYGDKDIMQSLFTKLQAHEDFKLDEKDNQGNTALMYAALYGNPDIIKLLREQKVNAGLQNKDGSTALKLAVERIIGNQGLVIPWPTVTPEFTMTKRALTTKGKYDDYVAVMDELTSFDVRGDDARAMKRILRDYATKDRNINKKNNAFEIDVPQE